MIMPYVILVLGYAFLVSLFLVIFISLKGKWTLKFFMVPVLIWFGLFLYFIPPQLQGYPSTQEILEDKVIVRYYTYQPPTNTQKGYIYVLVDNRFFKPEKPTKSIIDTFNPKTYTNLSEYEEMRLYKIEWDQELTEEMNKAKRKKQLIILRKSRGKVDQNSDGKGKDRKKVSGKKGKGDPNAQSGEAEGKGGTGGTAHESESNSKYSIEALSPNEVFRKSE